MTEKEWLEREIARAKAERAATAANAIERARSVVDVPSLVRRRPAATLSVACLGGIVAGRVAGTPRARRALGRGVRRAPWLFAKIRAALGVAGLLVT